MENIIEAEYKVIPNFEDENIEILTGEVNTMYAQVETIGLLGCQMMAEIGKRLIAIKGKVAHGQWEEWMEENLHFSKRKANYLMKYAEKTADENSIFSNPQLIADLGVSSTATKVFALLGEPEEVVKEVVNTPGVEELNVKEFKEEIKKLKEENAALSKEKEELEEARENAEQALREKEALKRDCKASDEQIREAEAKAKEAEGKLEKAAEDLQKAKDKLKKAKEDKEAAIRQAEAEANSKAEIIAEEKIKTFEKENSKKIEELEETIRKMEKKAANNADTNIVEFKLVSRELQSAFNNCLEIIDKTNDTDPVNAAKLKQAMKAMISHMSEMVEG